MNFDFLSSGFLPPDSPSSNLPSVSRPVQGFSIPSQAARDATLQDLTQAYHYYNQQFFQGKLPLIPIRWSDRMTRAAGIYYGTKGYIALSRPLLADNPSALASTLVHEMIHVWCDRILHRPQEAHGALFRAKMQEINATQHQIHITIRHTLDTRKLAKYKAYCLHCGRSRLYQRRNRGLACGACCQAAGVRWSQSFALVWERL
jgi:predicted SprT family Zn-dependent metalloprotease